MQTMRDKWTDERLDDLNSKVDRGFAELRAEIRAFRAEMNARFEAMNSRMDKMEHRIDQRIDAMNRNMLWFAGALVIALVASNIGIVASILAS